MRRLEDVVPVAEYASIPVALLVAASQRMPVANLHRRNQNQMANRRTDRTL